MTDVTIICPHCGQRISANEEYLGMTVECPTCEREFEAVGEAPKAPCSDNDTAGDSLPVREEFSRSEVRGNSRKVLTPALYLLATVGAIASIAAFGLKSGDEEEPKLTSETERQTGIDKPVKIEGNPEVQRVISLYFQSTSSKHAFSFQGFQFGQNKDEVSQLFQSSYHLPLSPSEEDPQTLVGGADYEWEMAFHFDTGDRLRMIAKTYEKDRDQIIEMLSAEFRKNIDRRYSVHSRGDGSRGDHWNLRFQNAAGLFSDIPSETGFCIIDNTILIEWVRSHWAKDLNKIVSEISKFESGRGDPVQPFGYVTEEGFMAEYSFSNDTILEAAVGKSGRGAIGFADGAVSSIADEVRFFSMFSLWPSNNGSYSIKPSTGHQVFVPQREWKSSDYKVIKFDSSYVVFQGRNSKPKL